MFYCEENLGLRFASPYILFLINIWHSVLTGNFKFLPDIVYGFKAWHMSPEVWMYKQAHTRSLTGSSRHHTSCLLSSSERQLQWQSAVNWLQQAAIETDLVRVNFPNQYIPKAQHSWLTKIEIVNLIFQVPIFYVNIWGVFNHKMEQMFWKVTICLWDILKAWFVFESNVQILLVCHSEYLITSHEVQSHFTALPNRSEGGLSLSGHH